MTFIALLSFSLAANLKSFLLRMPLLRLPQFYPLLGQLYWRPENQSVWSGLRSAREIVDTGPLPLG